MPLCLSIKSISHSLSISAHLYLSISPSSVSNPYPSSLSYSPLNLPSIILNSLFFPSFIVSHSFYSSLSFFFCLSWTSFLAWLKRNKGTSRSVRNSLTTQVQISQSLVNKSFLSIVFILYRGTLIYVPWNAWQLHLSNSSSCKVPRVVSATDDLCQCFSASCYVFISFFVKLPEYFFLFLHLSLFFISPPPPPSLSLSFFLSLSLFVSLLSLSLSLSLALFLSLQTPLLLSILAVCIHVSDKLAHCTCNI